MKQNKHLFKFFREVSYALAVTLLVSPLPNLTVSSLIVWIMCTTLCPQQPAGNWFLD